MKTVNKIWKFLVNCSLFLVTWFILFICSIILVSITQKDTVYYGNRCTSTLQEEAIDYVMSEDIIAYDYNMQCNTLYLNLSVDDEMNKEQITALLIRISTYYKNINFTPDTQVTVKNSKYLVLANLIEDGSVSLTVTEL